MGIYTKIKMDNYLQLLYLTINIEYVNWSLVDYFHVICFRCEE